MKHIQYFALLFLFFASCSSKQAVDNHVFHASLKETKTSLTELFSKISVVPLETVDSSLIIFPVKVIEREDRYYLLDDQVPALLVFEKDGTFVRKIGKKGKGPGEFTYIYDALISKYDNLVYMLSPFGKMYCYDLKGKFIKEMILPPKCNYQSMIEYNKDLFVFWSIPDLSDPGISVVSKSTMEKVKSFYYSGRVLAYDIRYPFSWYNGDVYFLTSFDPDIYIFDLDGIHSANKWDFGEDNLDIRPYFTFTKDKEVEEVDLLQKYLDDSTIPYIKDRQYFNHKYSFINLGYEYRILKSFFYRKKDGKSFLFERTTEGISIRPLSFNDDYMTCAINTEDFSGLQGVIPPEEYAKLEARSEDDNPCLLKLYFR